MFPEQEGPAPSPRIAMFKALLETLKEKRHVPALPELLPKEEDLVHKLFVARRSTAIPNNRLFKEFLIHKT